MLAVVEWRNKSDEKFPFLRVLGAFWRVCSPLFTATGDSIKKTQTTKTWINNIFPGANPISGNIIGLL